MENTRIVTAYLEEQGIYPVVDIENEEDGLVLSSENTILHISGNSYDLIELADYLVSLALSGKNTGQHWHIDQPYIVNEKSQISEIIIRRNKCKY